MNISSVLQGFVGLLWLGVIGLIIVAVVRASRGLQGEGALHDDPGLGDCGRDIDHHQRRVGLHPA